MKIDYINLEIRQGGAGDAVWEMALRKPWAKHTKQEKKGVYGTLTYKEVEFIQKIFTDHLFQPLLGALRNMQ